MIGVALALVLFALAEQRYGAVHWRVMARAASIPLGLRLTIAARERLVVPVGLSAAAGAIAAHAYGCAVAVAAGGVVAVVLAALDGVLAGALTVASRETAEEVARVHTRAGAAELTSGELLERLRRARRVPDSPEA